MATKREDISNLVEKTMIGRDITSNSPEKFNPPPKRQVQIRFDPGDYETLQRIAHNKGSTAAALIREAVKGIIKREITG
jgi:hypothetical protein